MKAALLVERRARLISEICFYFYQNGIQRTIYSFYIQLVSCYYYRLLTVKLLQTVLIKERCICWLLKMFQCEPNICTHSQIVGLNLMTVQRQEAKKQRETGQDK